MDICSLHPDHLIEILLLLPESSVGCLAITSRLVCSAVRNVSQSNRYGMCRIQQMLSHPITIVHLAGETPQYVYRKLYSWSLEHCAAEGYLLGVALYLLSPNTTQDDVTRALFAATGWERTTITCIGKVMRSSGGRRMRLSTEQTHLDVMTILLEHPLANPNIDNGRLLMSAVDSGSCDMARLVIDHPDICKGTLSRSMTRRGTPQDLVCIIKEKFAQA